jgi:uncharacterized membrane protein YdbT with pleckstrin-like domain
VAVDLHEGEEIIFQGHPSWRSLMAFYIQGALASALLGFLVWLVTLIGGQARVGTAVLIGLVAFGLVVLVGFVRRWATVYTVTSRRLHIKRGIIARHVQETRLERVQNVNYSQTVMQRVLQVGDVDFDTAGTDDSDFVFTGLSQPEHVVAKVDRATGIASADPSGLGQPAS